MCLFNKATRRFNRWRCCFKAGWLGGRQARSTLGLEVSFSSSPMILRRGFGTEAVHQRLAVLSVLSQLLHDVRLEIPLLIELHETLWNLGFFWVQLSGLLLCFQNKFHDTLFLKHNITTVFFDQNAETLLLNNQTQICGTIICHTDQILNQTIIWLFSYTFLTFTSLTLLCSLECSCGCNISLLFMIVLSRHFLSWELLHKLFSREPSS